MATRTLYLVRHGEADVWGTLTERGRAQSRLLGERLARSRVPVDVVWHSPLPRAAECARLVAEQLPGVLVDEAPELVDHVPYVPAPGERPAAWAGFFDGYGPREAADARAAATALTDRFAAPRPGARSTTEVLVTHAYPVAWLVREALGAPAARWTALAGVANASLTVVTLGDGDLPAVATVGDQSDLPRALRWTGTTGGPLP